MVFLIDPNELYGKQCPKKVEPCLILCSTLCSDKIICDKMVPLYGIDPI